MTQPKGHFVYKQFCAMEGVGMFNIPPFECTSGAEHAMGAGPTLCIDIPEEDAICVHFSTLLMGSARTPLRDFACTVRPCLEGVGVFNTPPFECILGAEWGAFVLFVAGFVPWSQPW